jgi:hypothetical protein
MKLKHVSFDEQLIPRIGALPALANLAALAVFAA